MFSKFWFDTLDKKLREMGLDSDDKSFDEIKENLSHPKKLSPDEFAYTAFYVILAGGFSQKTAKKIHKVIVERMPENPAPDELLKIFNNKNKINAICKIWQNKDTLCKEFYKCNSLEDKLNCLSKLPHIGKITANHLARNLGENVVKYDIWIQRLGVLYGGNRGLCEKIDNKILSKDIKKCCDDMFAHLEQETSLPRGYIDVVLWKSCQNGLISMADCLRCRRSCMSNTLPLDNTAHSPHINQSTESESMADCLRCRRSCMSNTLPLDNTAHSPHINQSIESESMGDCLR